MSNTRYLEFDSTYRNRNEWPLPGEFEVLISQTGRKDHHQAVDPVSDAANITRWTSNEFIVGGGVTLTVTVDAFGAPNTLAATSSQQKFIVTSAAGSLQQITNYYNHAIANNTTISQEKRITAYEYLGLDSGGNDRASITIDSAYGNTFAVGNTINISDPTDLNDPTLPLYFVPNGKIGSNVYPHHLLYNETRSLAVGTPVYRVINNYDVITHLLRVDTTQSIVETNVSGPVTSWADTHVYSIRLAAPLVGTVNNNIASNNVVSLILDFPTEQDYFRSSWIRMTSGASIGEVQRIVRYETFSGNVVNVAGTDITLPPGASTSAGYYNGAYFQALGLVRQVIAYDPSTRTITLDSAIAGLAPGNSFAFRSAFVSPSFNGTVISGDSFEILYFSYDNMNPFVYTGSQVSQQEMVCYEIKLLKMSLPNKTLNSGFGSRIAFYPYVYIEIANVSGANAGTKNTIYSNNPNATRMVFRATINDVPNPVFSSFVKVSGDDMTQTIKFKPNDNLRFSVRLSNGDIYQTLEQENFSPKAPNPEIQISAVFSIKRL
jgi:hypothetical protein